MLDIRSLAWHIGHMRGWSAILALGGALALGWLALWGLSEAEQTDAAWSASSADHLLQSVNERSVLPGLQVFQQPLVTNEHVQITLSDSPNASRGRALATVTLLPHWEAQSGDRVSPSFAIRTALYDPDPVVASNLEAGLASIIRNDNGRFWRGKRPFDYWLLPTFELVITLLLLSAWLAFVVGRRGRDIVITGSIKSTHLLVMSLHITLLSYWALYWEGVVDYVPVLLSHVAFGIAVDALLALSMTGRWAASLAPIPIVGSTSLFVWFRGIDGYLGFLCILLALVSKVVFTRGGKHIFNPSALGVTLVATLCIFAPQTFGYIDISEQLNLPPNMAEVILLVALIAQTRVPIVLISLSGFITMLVCQGVGLSAGLSPYWPAVLLALLLLVTDPATSPRTGLGRIFFGAAFGFGIASFDVLLAMSGTSTFFAKVLPVPIVNYFVPHFDRAGQWLKAKAEGVVTEQHNGRHITVWLMLAVLTLFQGVKEGAFTPNMHVLEQSRHIRTDGSGRVTCEVNPAHCAPFSIAEEIALWTTPEQIARNKR